MGAIGAGLSALQGPFGRQDALDPPVDRYRPAKGPGKGLEDRLRHVMAVCTIVEVDVQCYSTLIGKGLEELSQQTGIESSNPLDRKSVV